MNVSNEIELDRKTGGERTVVSEHHVVFEDVENSTHLRENENSGALGLHRCEQLVEDDHLSGVVDNVLVGRVGRSRLGSVEEVGVVAALSELHDDVEQSGLALLLASST